MAASRTVTVSSKATIEDDVAEFASLMGATVRDLKSAGPPPPELRDAAERASLGKRHMAALLAVAAAGPLSVSDLAKRLGLLLSTTSTVVGQLSRAGLLERSEDDEDRRRTIVDLHGDYRPAVDAWLDRAMAPVRATMAQLSPQARAHFMEGWRVLREQAARGADPDFEADCEG